MIYVYAIGEAARTALPPGQPGLGGARLRLTTCGDIAAVYSRHRTLRPQPAPRTMWSHEAVVERLMRRAAVLPLRFGTMLGDEQALRAILAQRHDELIQGLERVRGRVELSLRVLRRADQPRPPEHDSGRAYLLARREEHRRAERAAREVHEPLATLARDVRLRAPAPPPALLLAAYLLDEPQVETFKARVVALAAGRDDLSIVGTGPWPPYSFVPELAP
jgi:hypothetical protein